MDDIKTAALIGADYIAVSFPKSASDMYMARQLMRAAGGHAMTIAKIERVEAVAALEEILDSSDGLMVARGDLAVEVGDAAVPSLQKRMIRMAREKQAGDHRHANDGVDDSRTDADPRRSFRRRKRGARRYRCRDAFRRNSGRAATSVHTAESMARICLAAERSMAITLGSRVPRPKFSRIDQSIAMSSLFAAYHMNVKAIAALTSTGSTALWMSRLNCGIPIFALTQ